MIVQGSFTSVKEQMPGTYAAKLAAEGFVFDYAHYGHSDGLPRQFESPGEKLADLQAALSYLEQLPYVGQTGMLGICTSAGNAAYLAARDPRLKAMATSAAFLADSALFPTLFGEDGLAERRTQAAAAREKFAQTGQATTIPAYSETDPGAVNYRAVEGAYDYYLNPERGNVPEYVNGFDVGAWDAWLGFDPIGEAPARRSSSKRKQSVKRRSPRTDNSAKALAFLEQHPGSPAGAVVEHLGASQGGTYNLLARLVKDGQLVKRDGDRGRAGYYLPQAAPAASESVGVPADAPHDTA